MARAFRCGRTPESSAPARPTRAVVKLTFAKGASLEDPSGLFNSSLEGNTRRAIDFHEGDKIDEKALKALIRAAVALNISARALPRRNQRALEKTTAKYGVFWGGGGGGGGKKKKKKKKKMLEAAKAAGDRAGGDRGRTRKPDLAGAAAARKVAVDRAHRDLFGTVRDAGAGVDAGSARRLDQLDADSLERVEHPALHAVVAYVLAAELQEAAYAGCDPHPALRRPYQHGVVVSTSLRACRRCTSRRRRCRSAPSPRAATR